MTGGWEMRARRGDGMQPRWRSDGRWEARYLTTADDDRKVRRSIFVATPGRRGERECQRRLEDALANERAGIRPSTDTLGDYLTAWHAKPTHRWADETRRRYGDLVKRVASMPQGRIPLAEVDEDDLEDLYGAIPLSPKSVQLLHSIIGQALSLAVRRKRVTRNVAREVKPPRVTKREYRVLTGEQVRLLLDAAEEDPQVGAFVVAASLTGMRHGEVLSIRRSDLRDGRLTLRDPEKGGTARTLRLPARARRVLFAHKARVAERQMAAGGAYEATLDLLFANQFGERLDQRQVRVLFHRLCERAGVPRIRVHDLRHGYATMLTEQGIPSKVIAEIMGWADTEQLHRTYQHVTEPMMDAALAAVDRVVGE